MRPDPDKILKQITTDEEQSKRGKLKLFFGASPGVGKTYAMLESARQRKKEGTDVVAGIVETHGRVETTALLEGLEILPRKIIDYRGVKIHEFDLDAALARRPTLILVDELAHTNAPGSRHLRRWQDVEELLDAGIDVYTTLNVQHWETLNDVVAQITGVTVRETVPDTFLKSAHEVELVDLPPDELLNRLKEGKIYMGELAGRAQENFFKPGNLIALRELALRHAAERVDAQMQKFKEDQAIHQVWNVGERLLVGVSHSPMSARLIRATARMATRLRSPWIAVHVETPLDLRLLAEDRNRVVETLRLARELGAETVSLSGENATEELLNYARARNISKIVLGKPARPRWKEWLQGSIVNEIARRAGDIDLYVISGTGATVSSTRPHLKPRRKVGWRLTIASFVVALETLLCHFLLRGLDRTNLAMIYILGLVWIAYRLGRRPALLASVLSVLSFDFFFVPPYFSFAVTDTEYLLTFIGMLAVGFVISSVTGRLRSQTMSLRERSLQTEALYTLSRLLSETPDPRDLVIKAQQHLSAYYHSEVLLVLPDSKGSLEIAAGSGERFGFNDHEIATAHWVFVHGQAAGSGTDTLSASAGLYIPLRGIQSTVGILGIKSEWTRAIPPEKQQLLETFASEIGGALESTRLTETAGRAEAQIETERLKNLILRTFSFDLNGPLEKISSKIGALLASPENLIDGKKAGLEEIGKEVSKLKKVSEELPELLADIGKDR